MNFGQSNTEIARKMADGRLLFLALYMTPNRDWKWHRVPSILPV